LRGEEDHRHDVNLAKLRQQLDPVQVRHLDVEDRERGRLAREFAQRLGAVGKRADGEFLAFEKRADLPQNPLVVVHHPDRVFRHDGSAYDTMTPSPVDAARGKYTSTSHRPPPRSATAIRPPARAAT